MLYSAFDVHTAYGSRWYTPDLTCSHHWYLSICPTWLLGLYPGTEAVGVKRLMPGNSLLHVGKGSTGHKTVNVGRLWSITSQLYTTSHKSSWQYGAQWLPPVWNPQYVLGWQVICNRCQHEASCPPPGYRHLTPIPSTLQHKPWWDRCLNVSNN
jgi:hypothetical protein